MRDMLCLECSCYDISTCSVHLAEWHPLESLIFS
ncbi:hypothetical protein N665_0224s0028 [Sinapis alba]|nr:hypothetical protein N665_0224s0028 [Sinapis alba]